MKPNNITDAEFRDLCEKAESMKSVYEQLGIAATTFRRKAKKLGCYRPNPGGKGCRKP